MPSVQQQLDKLRDTIRKHDRLYYVDAKPEISDLEYDKLMKKLQDLEAKNPTLITADSPSQRVGGEPMEGFNTVPHRLPMLSIDNTYSEDEMREFDKKLRKVLKNEEVEYVVELKIDGVAGSLTYEDGLLTQALTRGDGVQGDDITHNVRTIKDVPLKLNTKNPPKVFEIRTELYMTNTDLAKWNQKLAAKGKPPLANARNATAGSIKLLDPKLTAERPLRHFVHSPGYIEGLEIKDHIEFLKIVKDFGLIATPYVEKYKSIDDAIEKCNEWIERTHELDFEIDGLVLKANSFEQREKAGNTSKAPRWVFAYKFEKYEAVTKLNEVTIQVGKTGALTPVAELEPVQIAGTTVSRASLHNYDEIKRKDIRVGDTVIVEKAGKIIPHVVRVELKDRDGSQKKILPPKKCPVCKSPAKKDDKAVFVYCTNDECPGRFRKLLEFFGTRGAMDIDGLGENKVNQLIDANLVKSPPDLYRLTVADIMTLERTGEKSAQKLYDGIQASKNRDLWRLITSMAISHVGKTVSHDLADEFQTLDRIMAASEDELSALDSIGPVIAESVYSFFREPAMVKMIQELKDLGLNTKNLSAGKKTTSANAALSGKTLVVTGTLVKYKRDEIQDLIAEHGGKASSSVSKKTDYLVAGDAAGSKLTKAQQLGVTVLTEDEFEALLK